MREPGLALPVSWIEPERLDPVPEWQVVGKAMLRAGEEIDPVQPDRKPQFAEGEPSRTRLGKVEDVPAQPVERGLQQIADQRMRGVEMPEPAGVDEETSDSQRIVGDEVETVEERLESRKPLPACSDLQAGHVTFEGVVLPHRRHERTRKVDAHLPA